MISSFIDNFICSLLTSLLGELPIAGLGGAFDLACTDFTAFLRTLGL